MKATKGQSIQSDYYLTLSGFMDPIILLRTPLNVLHSAKLPPSPHEKVQLLCPSYQKEHGHLQPQISKDLSEMDATYQWQKIIIPDFQHVNLLNPQVLNTAIPKLVKIFADYGNLKTVISDKGVYIKYIGGSAGFYKFFQKKFVDQEAIDLNISCPSNFFRKNFMVPSTNFRFLFKSCLQQYFRGVLIVIFKFQITKEVNIHNNIQRIIFK